MEEIAYTLPNYQESVMHNRAQISSVMRDLLFSQCVTRDFPLTFL